MKHALFALLLLSTAAGGASKSESNVFDELSDMDTLLFERSFNNCEEEVLERIIHQDFEFYHDQSGLQNRAEFIKGVRDNICSSPDKKPIRKLAKGSVKVFSLTDNGEIYGAIQSGEHDFYIKEPEKPAYKTSVAKFTHLWVLQGDAWKLKRVLSFDHQTPSPQYPSIDVERSLDAGYRPSLFDKDGQINALLTQHKIPSLAIGVIEHGQIQQIKVYGDQPASAHGLYNVASLTKPVVALAVLRLIETGQWNLDTPLADHYIDPDLRGQKWLSRLTTRHVLSHQTGFPNWRFQAKDKKLTFGFEPGTRYQYSGEGYEYLRKAVEAKFGQPFEDIAQREVFTPLDMHDTYFYWSDKVNQHRYQPEHDVEGQIIDLAKHTEINAADNLITTVEDYSKFMQYIIEGAGLSEALYQQMVSGHVSIKQGTEFGLGWQRFNDLPESRADNEYALQHTGSDRGTKSLAIILPNSKRGLVVLSNSDNGSMIWAKLISEHFGKVGDKLLSINVQ